MQQQPVPEHHHMSTREIVRRTAWWLFGGFLLCLAVSMIVALSTHHSGVDAGQLTGIGYLVLSAIYVIIRHRLAHRRAT